MHVEPFNWLHEICISKMVCHHYQPRPMARKGSMGVLFTYLINYMRCLLSSILFATSQFDCPIIQKNGNY
jgi:hypothetical protein